MVRPRHPAALLCLLLVALPALGVHPGHPTAHALKPELAQAPRFDAGHEDPISEEHLESAALVPDDACLACALRHSPTSLALRGAAQARVPPLAGGAAHESHRHARRHELGRLLGRAPPG